MASRAGRIAAACSLLASHENNHAVIILARALLESLITLLWVVEDESNPQALRAEALNELRRAARISMEQGLLTVRHRDTGVDHSKEFLDRADLKKIPHRKTVEQRAREAGVYDLYCVFYRFLSMVLHDHSVTGARDSSECLMCVNLQGIGAFLNCTVLVVEGWLSNRTRPSNEQLRMAIGLPGESRPGAGRSDMSDG